MMNARIRKLDGVPQELRAHCRTVSLLAGRCLAPLGFESMGVLAGLLHDMGKAASAFQSYLSDSFAHPERPERASTPHAPVGAIFAYENWFRGTQTAKLTAQIVSMSIYGHHAGLPDCLNEKGESPYLSYFSPEGKTTLHYDEAVNNYLHAVASHDELDVLFKRAREEVNTLCSRLDPGEQAYQLGMIARTVLSAVVDADRWDSACFERSEDPLAAIAPVPDWMGLQERLEAYMSRNFTEKSPLNDIRARISEDCLACAGFPPGIFTLTVPTGGGKTFSTLRFALRHACNAGMRRAFYIIPFNTILDQNAVDIREALGGYEGILEHHSGVVWDDEEEESEYKLLTERWDSPIILTSMVHFLNSIYRKENTQARRMNALAQSVLIFDEIQALPKHCTHLFERAIRFLAQYCGCTVVLCTATQPRLALPAREMIGDVTRLFADMRRIRFADESRAAITNAEAAQRFADLMENHGCLLAVVNTKAVAQDIYRRMKEAQGEQAECFHLSTNMCPAHRLKILEEVKERTRKRARKPTFLISTALIEAGINVSFPAVVRSLAGLPSVIQAGGRCNRNAEDEMGTVYLWKLAEENLKPLPEIRSGQELSDAFLRHFEDFTARIGDPDVINLYFEDERNQFEKVLPYPYPHWNTNLCEMLSMNGQCVNTAREARKGVCSRLAMPQSFRTAGTAFEVIRQETRSILVPYGDGKEIIEDLLGRHDIWDEIRLIRRAQRFSVSVYENLYRALEKRGAIYALGETGIVALRGEFYSEEIGLKLEPGMMDLLNYD